MNDENYLFSVKLKALNLVRFMLKWKSHNEEKEGVNILSKKTNDAKKIFEVNEYLSLSM
jgi:hypothetical protein